MATTQFGLLSTGFVPMQQSDIIAEIEASLQNAFTNNINLSPESIFGQIVGIFSEREALIWQLDAAVYSSQYPSGAQGTSVDNILALNNLKRLAASPTITNPTPLVQGNTIPLYGLVLGGVAGTSISAGSIIQTTASPPLSFTLDQTVVIAAAQNAIQSIFFSNVPTQGDFQFSIEDYLGSTLTSEDIQWNALAVQSQLSFSGAPGSATYFTLTLTLAGVTPVTTGHIACASTYPTAMAIQIQIQALGAPYASVTVSGSAGAYTISWGSMANPLTTIGTQPSGVTVTPIDSVQAAINNLQDTNLVSPNQYPFTDVVVSGTYSSGFIFTFGSGTVVGSNPVSSSQPQALMLNVTNSLKMSSTVTNINIVDSSTGAPSQQVGTATCTIDGPNFVKAGTLVVIGSPVSGWNTVNNQLDCITGTNIETDTQALQRRTTLLAANANGPLQAIKEKVSEVKGVTAVVGFQNLTNAALQVVTFASAPSTGNFQVQLGLQATGNISATATATQIQTAIQALTGYSRVLVTGSTQAIPYQFTIDFNGSDGGQAQDLGAIINNTTGVAATIAFGRPPHSVEIIVEGGTPTTIAEAIFGALPAGIEAYGSPVLVTTADLSDSSPVVTSVASTVGLSIGLRVMGQGIISGTTIVSVNSIGSTVTLSTTPLITMNGVSLTFSNTVTVYDQYDSPYEISYSVPLEIPIYIAIVMVTDIYNVPGDSGSGLNPNSTFNVGSVTTIQSDLVAIGTAVPIGGTIIGFGTNGLIGCFNGVAGIVDYTLYFGTTASPGANTNISLQPNQLAVFESFNISISYT